MDKSTELFVNKGGLVLRTPISPLSSVWKMVYGVSQHDAKGNLRWTWLHKPVVENDSKPFNLDEFLGDHRDDLNEFGDDFSFDGEE